MNTKQHNKLAMYLAVKSVLDANNSSWQSMQAFADGYTDLNGRITTIQTLGQSQTMDNTGIAQDKKQSKLAMATAAYEIASATHVFAVKNKNNTLATETDFTLSDLTRARDMDAVENCQNIHDAANTNIASLAGFGVTAAKLTALQTVIDAFSAVTGKPRDAVVAGKTVTQQVDDAFTAADETLEEGLDKLIVQFKTTDAKFVSDYNNARTIVDTAASHASPNQPAPAPQAKPQPQAGA